MWRSAKESHGSVPWKSGFFALCCTMCAPWQEQGTRLCMLTAGAPLTILMLLMYGLSVGGTAGGCTPTDCFQGTRSSTECLLVLAEMLQQKPAGNPLVQLLVQQLLFSVMWPKTACRCLGALMAADGVVVCVPRTTPSRLGFTT